MFWGVEGLFTLFEQGIPLPLAVVVAVGAVEIPGGGGRGREGFPRLVGKCGWVEGRG